MFGVNQNKILKTLSQIPGPDGSGDVVSLGLLSEILIKDKVVSFAVSVDPKRAAELEPWRAKIQDTVENMRGVTSARVILTAQKEPAPGPDIKPRSSKTARIEVPGVKHIIAVASGKGGVGKSTTAVNIALSLKALGHDVGILDADIYGPSLPKLMGIHDKPEIPKHSKLKPMENYGTKVMSMGFLVDEDTPMIWRGPMVISAITQMLREVDWGTLDFLIVDMPPGTGDAQLTLSQQVSLSGAVIVSTPQDLALIDAKKGLNMFRKVEVPVLGIVENMSTFICPKCGEVSEIFGHGGAKKHAEDLGVEFLGEIPLVTELRELSDAGTPVVALKPESEYAAAYKSICEKMLSVLERESKPAPKLTIN